MPCRSTARQVVGGSGVLAELTAPALPLRDYATLMVRAQRQHRDQRADRRGRDVEA